MATIVTESAGLGIGKANIKGIVPDDVSEVIDGWYDAGREPHRLDGRPSKGDFLPAKMTTSQIRQEENIMATQPSVKTPGSTVQANPSTPKQGPSNGLSKATGSTPPKGGGGLK